MDTPIATPLAGRQLRELPGPRPWPLVGNLAQIELPRMHTQLEAWAAEHGPLYRFCLGRRETLVVARPDLIASLLRDRPDGWRRMAYMQSVIQEMGAHGLFSAEGDGWRRQRRLVMGAFDPGHLRSFFPSLLRTTERLRERLAHAAHHGEPLDLQTILMRYTVDVTAGLAFGIDLNTQQHPDNALRGHLDKMFPMLMRRINAPFPWWRYVKLPSDHVFDHHLAQVHAAVRGFIAAARERMSQDPTLHEQPGNLLEAMLATHDEAGGLSEDELVGNVLTVLLAGEDTTANTLAWLLHFLHTHADVWRELVEGVDAALAGDELPRSVETARGLDFIEQCANEAMRLKPVAPLFFMENNRETQLGGVALPEGSMVICLMRCGAVDAHLAGDAAEFRPSRWREAAGGETHGLLKASMPFGAGPRLCPGRYLAMLEIKMVVATLARHFELVDVSTPDGAAPQERIAFTMFPLGLRLKVAPRSR